MPGMPYFREARQAGVEGGLSGCARVRRAGPRRRGPYSAGRITERRRAGWPWTVAAGAGPARARGCLGIDGVGGAAAVGTSATVGLRGDRGLTRSTRQKRGDISQPATARRPGRPGDQGRRRTVVHEGRGVRHVARTIARAAACTIDAVTTPPTPPLSSAPSACWPTARPSGAGPVPARGPRRLRHRAAPRRFRRRPSS